MQKKVFAIAMSNKQFKNYINFMKQLTTEKPQKKKWRIRF